MGKYSIQIWLYHGSLIKCCYEVPPARNLENAFQFIPRADALFETCWNSWDLHPSLSSSYFTRIFFSSNFLLCRDIHSFGPSLASFCCFSKFCHASTIDHTSNQMYWENSVLRIPLSPIYKVSGWWRRVEFKFGGGKLHIRALVIWSLKQVDSISSQLIDLTNLDQCLMQPKRKIQNK